MPAAKRIRRLRGGGEPRRCDRWQTSSRSRAGIGAAYAEEVDPRRRRKPWSAHGREGGGDGPHRLAGTVGTAVHRRIAGTHSASRREIGQNDRVELRLTIRERI